MGGYRPWRSPWRSREVRAYLAGEESLRAAVRADLVNDLVHLYLQEVCALSEGARGLLVRVRVRVRVRDRVRVRVRARVRVRVRARARVRVSRRASGPAAPGRCPRACAPC